MEPNQIISTVKSELEKLKKSGHKDVSIQGLENYLDGLSNQAADSKDIRLARYNAENQSNIEKYKEDRAEWRELFKATVGHSQSAIKLQALVNGGAAVALLAFIGKIWSPEFSGTVIAEFIPFALILYCCGVGAAVITQSLTYISQHYFTYDADKVAKVIRFFAQCTALLSLVLFFVATYYAYLGFTNVAS